MVIFIQHNLELIVSAQQDQDPCSRLPVDQTKYSQTLPYGHLFNTDTSLLQTVCLVPGVEKKTLTFFLQSTRFIQTPHYWKQFALSLGKESPYILSTLNPLNTDTPFIRKLSRVSSVSVLMGFILTVPEVPVKMFLQPNWQIKQFFFQTNQPYGAYSNPGTQLGTRTRISALANRRTQLVSRSLVSAVV